MSALRHGDALSGRMNQIVDRYLMMVEDDRDTIMNEVGADGFDALMEVWPDVPQGKNWMMHLRTALKSIYGWAHAPGIADAMMMCDADLIVLAEMVESAQASVASASVASEG